MDRYFEFDDDIDPMIIRIIKENGFIAIHDVDAVKSFCEDVVENEKNAKLIAQYKKGNVKVLGALVGQVMKRTNFGVEPPDMIETLLKEMLWTHTL